MHSTSNTRVPLFRAVHLTPHLAFLHGIGAPLERMLRQARLPREEDWITAGLVPLQRAMDFVQSAAREQGIEDLGLHAAIHLTMFDLSTSYLSAAKMQPTLYGALRLFAELGPNEANYTDFWVDHRRSGLRLLTSFSATADPRDIRPSEWNQIMCWLSIVRAYAGADWQPETLALQSSLPVGEFACRSFDRSVILTGQPAAGFDIPTSLLTLPPPSALLAADSFPTLALEERPANSFPESLKQCLRPYISDRELNIHTAAEIAGLSGRTLQRRLTRHRVSFTELKSILRFEKAAAMLRNPELRIIDIAAETGWEDPAHFSRAFRQIAGLSPSEFRKQAGVSQPESAGRH